MIDRTSSASIESPIPLRTPDTFTTDFERWACKPTADSRPATKDDFLKAWGEPQRKEVNGTSETWYYAEAGSRWCGIWIALVLPLPLLLPVCETYDEITFQNDLSVQARSNRFVRTIFGIALVPAAPGLLPVFSRAGNEDENGPSVGMFYYQASDSSCRWPVVEPAQNPPP